MKGRTNRRTIAKHWEQINLGLFLLVMIIFIFNLRTELLLPWYISAAIVLLGISMIAERIHNPIYTTRGNTTYHGGSAVLASAGMPLFIIVLGIGASWVKWNEIHGVAVPFDPFLFVALVSMVLPAILSWTWHKIANRAKEPIYSLSIQNEDFSDDPSEPITGSEAVQVLDAFPWEKKLRDKRTRERHKKETSPPGLLFNGEGTHLSIGITGEDAFWLHTNIPAPRGWRPRLRWGNIDVEIKNITFAQARLYTQAFFRKDYAFIAKRGNESK